MLEVVSLFREQGTVDELGIGPVRDAISSALFPGLSVLHTRARYLLFIPWLARMLEAEHVPSRLAAARFRRLEIQLIYALIAGEGEEDPGKGIIGIDARDDLKRMPSVVYWGALRRFGLLRHPGTVNQYLRSLDTARRADRHASKDDEDELTEAGYGAWHGGLPGPPEGLLDEATFQLDIEEADYLEERILTSVPGSLFAHLIAERAAADVAEPWQHPALASADPRVRRATDHARAFSVVMHAASLTYNLVLARKVRDLHARGEDDRVDEYRGLLADWADEVHADATFFERWDLDDFWLLVTSHNPRIHPFSRDFVLRWAGRALTDPAGLADDEEAARLVSDRERRVKGPLARVADLRQLERWSGASGLGRLDYRWSGAARAIVRDIVDARRPATVA
jgi:hypothetical protein